MPMPIISTNSQPSYGSAGIASIATPEAAIQQAWTRFAPWRFASGISASAAAKATAF